MYTLFSDSFNLLPLTLYTKGREEIFYCFCFINSSLGASPTVRWPCNMYIKDFDYSMLYGSFVAFTETLSLAFSSALSTIYTKVATDSPSLLMLTGSITIYLPFSTFSPSTLSTPLINISIELHLFLSSSICGNLCLSRMVTTEKAPTFLNSYGDWWAPRLR